VAEAAAGQPRTVCEAAEARAYGLTADGQRPAAPSDAVEANEVGVSLAAALAWREAGFILPDAALLIQDGWTLEEATRTRYEGIAGERAGSLRRGLT
jgi:hypothetical protein